MAMGFRLLLPAMQAAIETAMNEAIENNYYNPIWDLPLEDYDEEYLAMEIIDPTGMRYQEVPE